jgi:hypothetical protein
MSLTQQAADKVTTDLMQYGFGGAILAVFVAPILFVLVKSSQRREEERIAAEKAERERQAKREDRLLASLEQSVDQQRQALEQQRAFELGEQSIHSAITQSLAKMHDHQEKTAVTLAKIGENLQESTQVLRTLRRHEP